MNTAVVTPELRQAVHGSPLNVAAHTITGNIQSAGRIQPSSTNSDLETIGILSQRIIKSKTQRMLMHDPASVP
jgi:hypothetical protein